MKTEDKFAYGILGIGLLVGLPLLIYATNRPKPQDTALSRAEAISQEPLGDQHREAPKQVDPTTESPLVPSAPNSRPPTRAVTQSPTPPTPAAVASPPIQPAAAEPTPETAFSYTVDSPDPSNPGANARPLIQFDKSGKMVGIVMEQGQTLTFKNREVLDEWYSWTEKLKLFDEKPEVGIVYVWKDTKFVKPQ